MTTTLDLLEECRRLLWDRHDDDYAIDLRGRLEEHIDRESAQPNSRVVNDPLTTDVARWLAEKRFGPQHIGLGDIRLTIGDQEELLTMIAPTCKPDLHVCQPNPQPAPAVPTGWVMVPVEPTVGMCIAGDSARHNGDDMTRTPAIYRAMLSAAPQPAPKVESDECPYLIWYDDQDRKAEIFAGFGARTAALKRFAQVSANWNAHLFVRVQKNTKDDDSPCAEMNAAPQPAKAAPVAWYINSGHGRHVSFDLADNLKALRIGDRNVWTPLYAAPQPVPPAYPLPDSLYAGSKDWLVSGYAGRVEWLHMRYEGAKHEVNRLSAQPAPLTDDNIKDALIGTREELAAEVTRLRAMLSTPPAVPNAGRLWSFLRNVMTQGRAISDDHQGKTYEEYSARLDAAAAVRAKELVAMLATAPAVPEGE